MWPPSPVQGFSFGSHNNIRGLRLDIILIIHHCVGAVAAHLAMALDCGLMVFADSRAGAARPQGDAAVLSGSLLFLC